MEPMQRQQAGPQQVVGAHLRKCHMRTSKSEISIGQGVAAMSPRALRNFSGNPNLFRVSSQGSQLHSYPPNFSLLLPTISFDFVWPTFQASLKLNDQRLLKNKPWPVDEKKKKNQMQSAREKWGQDMVRGFASYLSCQPKLQRDPTLRVRLIQTGTLGNC